MRETHWDGLYLVPANLKLYSCEYELAARVARSEPNLLNRLADGIASIGDHFDVVILDPPPALGVRRVAGDPGYDYEVVCGARRHWTVGWLRDHGYPDFRFLIEPRELTDEEAFRAADLRARRVALNFADFVAQRRRDMALRSGGDSQ